MKTNSKDNQLKTLQRAFDLVYTIKDLDGAGVSELAEVHNMPVSTVHKYVDTLHEERFLIKENGEYHIGLEFLNLGGYAKSRKEVNKMAAKMVQQLADETGERSQFVKEEHGRGIYVEIVTENDHAKLNRRVGYPRYLHSSAAGKAILAHLPEYRRQEIIEQHGLPQETENTITDVDELNAELAEIRDRKVAFNDEESVVGLRAVGVPLLDGVDNVVGALSISGPAHRLKKTRFREELPDLLLAYSNEINLSLTYS